MGVRLGAATVLVGTGYGNRGESVGGTRTGSPRTSFSRGCGRPPDGSCRTVPDRELDGSARGYRRSFSCPCCVPSGCHWGHGADRRRRDGKRSRATTPHPPAAGVASARRGDGGGGGGSRHVDARQHGDRRPGGGRSRREPAAGGESGRARRPAPQDNAARTVPPSLRRRRDTTEPPGTTPSARRPKPAAALHPVPIAPPKETRGASVPAWAKSPEELVVPGRFHRHHHGVRPVPVQGKGPDRRKTGVPPERAGLDVRGPLVHLSDQRDDRLLSRRGIARPDPAGVHAAREGKGRRGPLQPGDREDHVPVPAVGKDTEGGRHDPFRLRPGERRLLFPVAGPGRREPSAEHVRGAKALPDLLARPRVRADPRRTTGRWTRSRSFR